MVAQGRLGFRFPPSGSFLILHDVGPEAQRPPRPTGIGSLGGFRCPTTLRGPGPLNRAIDGLALPNDPAFLQLDPCEGFRAKLYATSRGARDRG